MLDLYDAILQLKQAGFKSVFDDVIYMSIEDALIQAREDESGEVYSVSAPYIFKAPVRPTENVPVWVGSKEEITVEPPSEFLTADELLLFRMFNAFRAVNPSEEEAAKALILNAAAALRGWLKGGKRGGAAKSEAKAQAVRENGKKGGRPPEPKRTYMICLATDSTQHPPIYYNGTLKGAHREAKVRRTDYEPDCRYVIKVEREDAQGYKVWDVVGEG